MSIAVKTAFTLIYHTEQKRHHVPRSRIAYLLRAARSRGIAHRPQRQPSGDYILPNLATIFCQRPGIAHDNNTTTEKAAAAGKLFTA